MDETLHDLTQAQLFVDDTWIENSIRLQRVFHQPEKFQTPVIVPDRPWEQLGCLAYGSILYREGRFHLWYMTWRRDQNGICYARSDDGIHFEKPNLGIYEAASSRENNLCIMTEQPGYIDNIGVIDDPEDAEWPLKAILWQKVPSMPELRGLVACRSKDGIHWDKTPGLVLPGWGDRTNTFAEKVAGKYVILGRAPAERYNPYVCRIVFRTESEDLVHWSEPEMVLKPDVEDDARMEIYSAQAFRYESMYLGFIERMHMVPDRLDSELIYSHDSRQWRRTAQRRSFLSWGPPETWDDIWVNMPSNGPVLHQNRLWFYYSGRSGAHGAQFPQNCGAIGVATMRPDGFVSLQAREKEGWFVTPAVKWPALGLLVNADPRRDLSSHPRYCSGEVRVEVRDESNQPIHGFRREDCVPLTENTRLQPNARKPVTWNGRSLRELGGVAIRLAFFLRDAHLYSFQAGSDAP